MPTPCSLSLSAISRQRFPLPSTQSHEKAIEAVGAARGTFRTAGAFFLAGASCSSSSAASVAAARLAARAASALEASAARDAVAPAVPSSPGGIAATHGFCEPPVSPSSQPASTERICPNRSEMGRIKLLTLGALPPLPTLTPLPPPLAAGARGGGFGSTGSKSSAGGANTSAADLAALEADLGCMRDTTLAPPRGLTAAGFGVARGAGAGDGGAAGGVSDAIGFLRCALDGAALAMALAARPAKEIPEAGVTGGGTGTGGAETVGGEVSGDGRDFIFGACFWRSPDSALVFDPGATTGESVLRGFLFIGS